MVLAYLQLRPALSIHFLQPQPRGLPATPGGRERKQEDVWSASPEEAEKGPCKPGAPEAVTLLESPFPGATDKSLGF